MIDNIYEQLEKLDLDYDKRFKAEYFCDAINGKLDKNQIRKKVRQSRDKNLLVLYTMIPLKDDRDLLQRYEFIQRFLKESKQFKVKRRAAEKIACEVALSSLAINAGYEDSMRLVLAMENKITENMGKYLEEHIMGDIRVKLVIDEDGKGFISCIKNGEELSSVPGRYKDEDYIIELRSAVKKLNDQYKRVEKIMGEAFENDEMFCFSEIKALVDNPVIRPILRNLVVDFNKKIYDLNNKDKMNVS